VAVVLFAIGLTVVGAIAVAIVGLIDLIFLGLCELGVDALCFSIVGGWVEGLARLIYSGDIAIDTERDDLVTFSGMSASLTSPALGLQVGNSMLITATIRTRIYQKPPSSGYSTAYANAGEIFSTDNLRATTFNYHLGRTYISLSASRNQHPSAWLGVRRYGYVDHDLYGRSWYHTGYKLDTKYSGAIPLTAGVNEPLNLRFKAAMAIPSYECWVYVCDTDNYESADYSKFMGDDLVYDIFPLHLDGFVNVRSWGFGPQRDLDGDGLVAWTVFRGSDENDEAWDSDADGLSDAAELRAGSSNYRADSDQDGLSDLEEVRLGSNPARADSDRDGLTDKAELDGWLFEYAPGQVTRVFSELNNADSDLDGLSDLLERNLGAPYHPRVENPRPVALYAETSDDDDFLRPGQGFAYTATVRNEVTENWWANGSLVITAPVVLGGQSFSSSFVLGSGQQRVLARSLTVQASAASQTAPMDQHVNARLDQNPNGGGSQGTVFFLSQLPLTIDNDRPTSGVTGSGFVAAGGTRIVGIAASDPTSKVSRVQVRVQNGDWQEATRDGAFWLFTWDVPETEGEYVIFSRATDAVGWEQTPASASSVYVDAHAPTVTANLSANQVLAAQRNGGNRWVLPLTGSAADPTFGQPASGVEQVEVQLSPNGDGWQPATLITTTAPATWALDYLLPALDESQAVQVTPSGFYTVEVRARDAAGNLTAETDWVQIPIGIDNDAPAASLNGRDSITVLAPSLDETLTIGGFVTETGRVQAGVGGLEIALVPAEVVPALDDRTVALPLNEPPQAVVFGDVSGYERSFFCLPEQCPTSGAPGRFDAAVSFAGVDEYLDPLQLALPLTDFTTSLWFNTTCPNCGLFSADHGHLAALGHDRDLYLDAGKVCANLLGPGNTYEAICTVENGFADGQWHQVAHSVGPNGQVLIVDGVQRVRGFLTASSFSAQTGANLGFAPAAGQDFFSGSLDEFVIYNTALNEAEAATLYQAWQPVTLDSPGAPASAWSYDLPAGLEGFYQIDLRPTDVLGNRNDRRQDWRQWRGEIDTAYPAVNVQVAYLGEGESAQTRYRGAASDLNLVEEGFVSPCGPQTIERGYYASPWWAQWSNATPRLNALSFSCTVAGHQTDLVHVRACDAYGRCAAARPDQFRLFYTSKNYNPGDARILSLSTFDGADERQLINGLGGVPVALALDIPGGKMYWVENVTHPATASIYRANLDGSAAETLVSGIPAGTLGPKTLSLALDRPGGKMYWTSSRAIFRANLDGSGSEQLFTMPDPYHVAGVIALDLQAGAMYWTAGYSYGPNFDTGTIWRANLDGTGAQALSPNVPRMTTLAFDPAERKLYWMADNVIRRADPDGANVETVVTGVNEFFRTGLAVAPFGERLYWIEGDLLQQAEAGLSPAAKKTLRDTVLFAPVYDPWTLAIGRIPAFATTKVDLAIAKSEPIAEIAVQGATTQYSLVIRNQDYLDAHDVVVEDALPAGLSLASAQPPEANCAANGSLVRCNVGDFASGATLTITLTLNVAPGTSGFLTNSASITAREADFAPANNTITVAHTLAVAPATATPPASARYAYVGVWASIARVRLDQPGGSEIIIPYDQISTNIYFPIEGVGVDNLNGKLYWPHPHQSKIQRANLDGSGVEDFLTGVNWPTQISLDAPAGKIYWLSDYGNTLERANLDGSGRETLLTDAVIRTLALDPVRGKLYWVAATGTIHRSDLDGQNVETLVEDVFDALEIVVDPYGSKLYWVEVEPFAIRRANPDGTQIETVLESFAAKPVGLLLDAAAGKLYWFESDTLRRANLDGSAAEDVAANLPYIGAYGPYEPMNLTYLDLPTATPSPTITPSPTRSPTPTQTPTFDPIATDTNTPTPSNTPTPLPTTTPGGPAAAERIFWADIRTFLYSAPATGCADGSCVEPLLGRDPNRVTDLIVDSGNGYIYWADPVAGAILRADLDGANVFTVTSGLIGVKGLAFDPQEDQLYWSQPPTGSIHRVDANGSDATTLLNGLDTPTWLTLDTLNDRLYWYEDRSDYQQQIWRARLDGTDAQLVLADPSVGEPYYFLDDLTALEIDPRHGWLFWTDTGGSQPGSDFPFGRVNRFDLACAQAGGDGANSACFATIVQEDYVYPYGLGLDPNRITLYWASYTWDEDTHLPITFLMKSARMDGTLSGYPVTDLILLPTGTPVAVDVQYPLVCQPFADPFEPDDSFSQAVTLTLDAPAAARTFHTPTDADWLAFSAEEGQRYRLAAGALGTDVTPLLALYETDGATLLAPAAASLVFDPSASGRYFLRLTDANGAASCETRYTVSLTLGAFPAAPTPQPGPAPDTTRPVLDSAVLSPADGSVLNSLAQVTVSGGAYARDFLQTLNVSINGAPFFNQNWANGVITDTAWSAPWTPPAEGVYTIEAVASDWAGRVQTDTHPITVTVDLALPTISLSPTVYTTTHLLPGSSQVALGGLAADSLGVRRVEVNVNNEGWQDAVFDGAAWTYPWLAGRLDNVTLPISARVTDLAGKTTSLNQNILVDVAAPLPDGVYLYHQTASSLEEIFPGDTVYEANASLVITWTAATDASGLQAYRVGWTTSPTPPVGALSSVAPAGPLQHSQVVGEAQAIYAHLVSTDNRGNRTWLTFGPVYVDGPATPDLTSFTPAGIEPDPYAAWRGSGSTQIGADRELSSAAQGQIQRFYATWDAANLRLSWLGADWDSDGDLFIYFDTGSGGATTLFNPYTATATIQLPPGLTANALIWVEDTTTASLYTWNGSAWSLASTLTTAQFRFTPALQLPDHLIPDYLITDLSLPFSLLSLTPASSLRLLAVASEEDQLSLWAAAPDKNPLNSPRVISPLAQGRDLSSFALNLAYQWPSLGAGVQPNLGRFSDSDLSLSIQPDPAGVSVGLLASDLLDLLSPTARLDANGDGVLDVALPLDDNAYPLYDGQLVSYTIVYTNTGTQPAEDVVVTVNAYGALDLPGGTLTIPLGDIPAGATGTHTFQAAVDAALDAHSAELVATLADTPHGEYDWLWVQHDLDAQAPSGLQITAPLDFIRPYTQTIYGLVSDASGVPTIELEIEGLTGNAPTALLQCTDPTPLDGHWACEWNAGSTQGLTSFRLRARATDSFGNQSGWTAWRTVAVDNTAPAVSVDAALDAALADGFLSAAEARITGLVSDDRLAARLLACVDDLPCAPHTLSPGNTPVGAWSLRFPVDDLDGIERTLTLTGYDAVGNASAALERTFVVDSVAPALTAAQLAMNVPTGETVDILAGSVTDGGGVASLYARIQAADGTVTYQAVTLTGADWRLAAQFATPGLYTVSVEAYDRAGNRATSAAFSITVSGPQTYTVYLPLIAKSAGAAARPVDPPSAVPGRKNGR
jgi:sugar lactone lactonase YvrE